jgi:hypothetical protein
MIPTKASRGLAAQIAVTGDERSRQFVLSDAALIDALSILYFRAAAIPVSGSLDHARDTTAAANVSLDKSRAAAFARLA